MEQHNVALQSDEQRQAWSTACFLKDAGAGLEYWREEVSRQFGTEAQQESDCEPDELVGDDEEIDEQLREAIRISLKACADSSILPTPSPSPPEKRPRRTHGDVITLDSDDDEDSLYSRPPRTGSYSSPKSLKRMRISHVRDGGLLHPKHARKESHSIDRDRANHEVQQKEPRFFLSGTTPLDQLSSLSQQSLTPTSDAIEGDL
jgi:hypothetical protein